MYHIVAQLWLSPTKSSQRNVPPRERVSAICGRFGTTVAQLRHGAAVFVLF